MKAIIIGAGIGGLTTAIALEKHGIEVEIYEKSHTIAAVGAGLSLWKNAVTVLDALGLGEALRQYAITNGEGAIRAQSGTILTSMQQPTDDVLTIVVHRADLHCLLHEAVSSPIHLDKAFMRYQHTSDGVIAYFEDGTQAEGDVLLAADGIHSPIRKQMLPESTPVYSGYTAFRAVVDFNHVRMNGIWGESWGKGLRFGITPLSDNRVYWFCTENAPESIDYDIHERKQHIQKLFWAWHEPIADLIAETSAEAILHHDVYDIAPLHTWQDKHVILLGDAAHAMTPNLGQGACQAIEDAYALAHCLAENSSIESSLAQYQALRMPRAKQIMQQSRQIGRLGQIENPLMCYLRNQAVKIMPSNIRNRGLKQVIAYDIRTQV